MVLSDYLVPVWHYGLIPADCSRLREEVFLQEQGFSYDIDDTDDLCYHLCVYLEEIPVGVARLFHDGDDTMHIGRLAVKKAFRGQHIGTFLMSCLEHKAKELGAKRLILGAQMHAVAFYESCGFSAYGEPFDDDGAPHRHMEKQI